MPSLTKNSIPFRNSESVIWFSDQREALVLTQNGMTGSSFTESEICSSVEE